ncbi:MAG: hypothetical protein A4E37_00307 [Methanoregulaceae archaeon PtaB.Bin056]|nr:MAG: hypothetical protein A4E37_00307 [Methanoregulaceae archaeon PtaB.Bin056]
MDEATKEQLKWKFYRLAILLNAIILLVALGVIALLKLKEPYAVPAGAALLLMALGLAVYFRGQYVFTKRWLDAQVSQEPDREQSP